MCAYENMNQQEKKVGVKKYNIPIQNTTLRDKQVSLLKSPIRRYIIMVMVVLSDNRGRRLWGGEGRRGRRCTRLNQDGYRGSPVAG